MKKLAVVLFSLCCLLGFTSVASADLKVGVVNIRAVVDQSKRMHSYGEGLMKQFDPEKNQLIAEQKKLKEREDKFNRDAAVMNDKQKIAARDQLVADEQNLQKREQAFVRKVQERKLQIMEKSLNEINGIVASIAQKEGYNVIMQSGNVIYSAKEMDLTNRVLATFDGRSANSKS